MNATLKRVKSEAEAAGRRPLLDPRPGGDHQDPFHGYRDDTDRAGADGELAIEPGLALRCECRKRSARAPDALHIVSLAHYMADVQDDPAQELCWDLRALDASDSLTDARAQEHHPPPVSCRSPVSLQPLHPSTWPATTANSDATPRPSSI